MYSEKSKLPSSNMVFPNPKQFRETCLPQEFPIPMPIMKYIWTNPSSPKVYQKMIECCKIFFIKNPILTSRNLIYNYHETKKWYYCDKTECNPNICSSVHKEIDMDKIQDKIWITKTFHILNEGDLSNVFTIFPKLFRQEFEELDIRGWNVSFNELKIIAKSVKKIWIRSNVYYDNGLFVPLENLIRIFLKNTKVCIDFSGQYQNGFCKNYDDFINACNGVKEVYLYQIPSFFDILEFYRHLKKSKSHAFITIVFSDYVDHDVLVHIVDQILNTKFFEFVPPVINHFRLSNNKLQKMRQIRETEARKYFS